MPHPACAVSPGRCYLNSESNSSRVDVTDAEQDAPLPTSMRRQLVAFDDLLQMRLTKLQTSLEAKLQTSLEAKLCQESGTKSRWAGAQGGLKPILPNGVSNGSEPSTVNLLESSEPNVKAQVDNKALLSEPDSSGNVKDGHVDNHAQFSMRNSMDIPTGTKARVARSTTSILLSDKPCCECKCLRPFKVLAPLVNNRKFDIVVSGLVCANVIVMFVELERMGHENGVLLGVEGDANRWSGSDRYFELIEHVFNIAFLLELVLRFLVEGCDLFRSLTNVFDALIVVATCFEAYVLKLAMSGEGGANLSFARLARLLKVIKFMRAFRAAVMFSELRVLLRTLVSSMMALIWSVVLLSFIMVSSGILMAQLTASFIEDRAGDRDLRIWVWEHYGTGTRASYTMFEATLSGGWPNYARKLVERVSSFYALFWMTYVILVIFAVMRVITALFLNNTMKAASGDEQMMVMEKMKEKDKYIKKVVRFLEEGDTDGNGTLSRDEFDKLLANEEVGRYLTVIGLEMYEIETLFDVLDDGDGEISYGEFIGGCLRLKGAARAVDAVMIMHEQNRMHTMMENALTRLAGIEQAILS